ncbi:MAG: CopD family protein, partial [Acetobacteraceae bacterium]|nr:CopD family protein [Acetobacteraceae bacterium]
MALLVDLFGYLSILLHGLSIVAQALALGGVGFIVLLARPLRARLGVAGAAVLESSTLIAAWGALGVVFAEAATIALQSAVLTATIDIKLTEALGAGFAIAGMTKIVAAALIALILFLRRGRTPALPLVPLAAVTLAAATLTTHAEGRMDGRVPLLILEGLHQAGAAIWIGGLPCFLLALQRVRDPHGLSLVSSRYSRMSMAGVASILASGLGMSLAYIGDVAGFYGTAYGVMVCAKIAMFLMLLGLGAMNFRLVERLRRDPSTSVTQLRRFAEVELGIGFTIFFAAASLTSAPPAIDLMQDRVTFQEIVARNAPVWPRLTSPDHDALALPALQRGLDEEAARAHSHAAEAFTPGSGELPPRNAADIAWSEYNHHWAGLFVIAIALLAMLNQAGVRWARHWPLVFLGLAAFLFIRSDPETWPLGHIGLIESLRDVEVAQHRVFVLLVVGFAFFEWRVRSSSRPHPHAALVFPLISAIGGALLLTHSHAIANVKDALLIEITHT